ncbi:MAG: hypothetical protein JSW12_10370 [Deltaproteobacteria bacterium]|nr:MAG: hypothetical protein JSW12_10370 [Deltaproteobacteria bacterium]
MIMGSALDSGQLSPDRFNPFFIDLSFDKVHELTHIALWCFDEQVIVIAHEHITVKEVSVFVLSIAEGPPSTDLP